MYKKELAAHFDAGVAIDSVFFENCELPQPPDEGKSCEEGQWQCLNKVFTHLGFCARNRYTKNININYTVSLYFMDYYFFYRHVLIKITCVMGMMIVEIRVMKISGSIIRFAMVIM
jgi:hypothetical protein